MHVGVLLSSVYDPADYDPSPYLTKHRWEPLLLQPHRFQEQINAFRKKGFDVFLNLCDGTPDDPVGAVDLVAFLENSGAAFTGADAIFIDPSRAEMKAAAARAGVPYPEGIITDSVEEVIRASNDLRFPLIVKPRHGYSSFGLSRASRVVSREKLRVQTEHTIRRFGGVLIEEFIEGREFTVLVAENPDSPQRPLVFKPIEILFPPGETFKHYRLKWVDYRGLGVAEVSVPDLDERLRDLAGREFRMLGGNGYARCDFRMDRDGRLFMLEVNANCGFLYPIDQPGCADSILHRDPIGHDGFLRLLFRLALQRRNRTSRKPDHKESQDIPT